MCKYYSAFPRCHMQPDGGGEEEKISDMLSRAVVWCCCCGTTYYWFVRNVSEVPKSISLLLAFYCNGWWWVFCRCCTGGSIQLGCNKTLGCFSYCASSVMDKGHTDHVLLAPVIKINSRLQSLLYQPFIPGYFLQNLQLERHEKAAFFRLERTPKKPRAREY